MKRETFRLVVIEWEDALSKDGWHQLDEAREWAKEKDLMLDVGWLIEKNKEYALISPSWSDRTKQFDYLKKIPTSLIRKIDYLVDGKPTKRKERNEEKSLGYEQGVRSF